MYTEEKKLTQEEISWRQFNKYVKTALIRKRRDYLQKKARIMKHEMPQDLSPDLPWLGLGKTFGHHFIKLKLGQSVQRMNGKNAKST